MTAEMSHDFDLAEAWISACASMGRSPNTVLSYRTTIGVLRAWRTADPNLGSSSQSVYGGRHLETLTKLEARAFTKWMLDTYTPGGAAFRLRPIKAFYNWLVAEEEITASPFKGITVTVQAKPETTADDSQIAFMLASAKAKPRDLLMILILADTGARKGEVAALEFCDMDIRNRLITFRTSKTTPRIVPMSDRVATAYVRWAKRRGIAKGSLWSVGDPYVLVTHVVKKHSRGHLTPHSLRRAFAVSWLARGGSESGLMRVAGWSSGAMIRRYIAARASELAHDEYRKLMG